MHRSLATTALLLVSATASASASAAPPQLASVPLATSSEDDGAVASAFLDGGGHLAILHERSGSLTRMRLDTGEVLERLELGGTPNRLVSADGGTRLVALDSGGGQLHVVSAAPLSLERTVTVPALNWETLAMIEATGEALLVSRNTAAFVDIASGATSAFVFLPNYDGLFPQTPTPRVVVSPDGTRLIRPAGSAGSFMIEQVEVSSGAVLASASLPLTVPGQLHPSRDRGTFAVAGRNGVVRAYDSQSLTLLAERAVPGFAGTPRVLWVDGTGVLVGTQQDVHSVPFDLNQPIVSSSGVGRLEPLARGHSRLLVRGPGGIAALDPVSLQQTQVGLGEPLASPFASADPISVGERFAILGARREDNLDLVALTPAGPIRRLADAPTAAGADIDGPFQPVSSPLFGRGLLLCEASRALVEIELRSPARLGRRLVLPGVPVRAAAHEFAGAPRVLVGTTNGLVAVVDPVALDVAWTVFVAGEVVDIDPVPGQAFAWVRVDSGAGVDELVGVDLGSPQGPVGPRIVLGGTAGGVAPARAPWRETVVLAPGARRAYAAHRLAGEIDVIDLQGAVVTATVSPDGPPGPFTTPGDHTLTLSSDGSLLVRASLDPEVVAIDVTAASPAVLWSRTYGASSQFGGRGFRAEFLPGDVALVTSIRTSNPPFGSAGPGIAFIDPATGDVLDSFLAVASDFEQIGAGEIIASTGAGLRSLRFDGGLARDLGILPGSTPSAGALSANLASGTVVLLETTGSSNAVPQRTAYAFDLFEGRVDELCTGGIPGVLGAPSRLQPGGSVFAGGTLRLTASGLIPGALALTAFGDASSAPAPIAGSLGRLCLAGNLGRLTSQLLTASAAGTVPFTVDSAAIPLSSGVLAAAGPGSSWTFQVWHRDLVSAGQPTSNTTNAVRVEFR